MEKNLKQHDFVIFNNEFYKGFDGIFDNLRLFLIFNNYLSHHIDNTFTNKKHFVYPDTNKIQTGSVIESSIDSDGSNRPNILSILYKVLFLYNCFLEGWEINFELKNQIKLKKTGIKNFNINKFISENHLIDC